MAKDKKKNRSRRLYWYGVLIGLLIGTVLMIGGIVAKYTYQKDDENVVAAKVFYFSSNLLTEGGQEYVLNSEATSVSFTLGNNEDEVRYSDDDIKYTVSVTLQNKTDGDVEPLLDVTEGVLEKGKVTTDTITLSKLIQGRTYIVTATGTAGYQKTLQATFRVSDNEENVYKYLDTSNHAYVLLTVWTENVSGDAVITCNTEDNTNVIGLIPDSTDEVLKNVNNFDSVNNNYTAFIGNNEIEDNSSFDQLYSSRTYRFFIDEDKQITIDNFQVSVDNHLAATATP